MDAEAYSRALIKAQFCLCPAGDIASPGQRLFDAIAAGCVPILIGVDKTALPLSRQLDYTRFAGFISRLAFLKDPVFACESLLHRLAPQLEQMRRVLADARHRLLYGLVDSSNLSTTDPAAFGGVAPHLLQELELAVAASVER